MTEQPTPEPQNVTRRRFIKRTGGATVGTAIGLYALQTPAWAQENDDSVAVAVPSMDLGLDDDGFRSEILDSPPAPNGQNKYSWQYNTPNKPMTLPHDAPAQAGQPPPNQLTIQAVVDPASEAQNVSFRVAGDEPNCISIVGTTVKANGVIDIRIKAVAPSTPVPETNDRRPNGTLIEALRENKVVAFGKFYVLKPASINAKAAGTVQYENGDESPIIQTWHAPYESIPVEQSLQFGQEPPATLSEAWFIRPVEIGILDQFAEALSDLYAGTSVRESVNYAQNYDWINWMGQGSFIDHVGAVRTTPIGVYDLTLGIKVAGWDCGPMGRRTSLQAAQGGNSLQRHLKVTWIDPQPAPD